MRPFLLVHNLSNFDFQMTHSGVCIYEWNTFRNLLQDGRCVFGKSNEAPAEWRYREPLPVENPDEVIRFLMANSPVCTMSGGDRPFEADEVVASIEIGNTAVRCLGLGV